MSEISSATTSSSDDWTQDVSKFGIDIWMTTSALTGGFAVCQARLGAKVHDPKDPGRTSGRCSARSWARSCGSPTDHADAWSTSAAPRRPGLRLRADHRPAALEVNAIRLLSEFHAGSLTVADTWRKTIDPATWKP